VPAASYRTVLAHARATDGFMPDDEGIALFLAARRAVRLGRPLVEIGAYQGRSTLYIAAALIDSAAPPPILYSVDHHRGSEEMQVGWLYHDASLVDPISGRMDSLPAWRRNVELAGVERLTTGIVGDSRSLAADWGAALSFLFLDGGHGEEIAWADYRGWSRHVAPGGLLAIHDVFPDPRDGGRPPFHCYEHALLSGRFVEEPGAGRNSLKVLRCLR